MGTRHEVDLPLVGGFQASNALAALGLVVATGGDAADAVEALAHLTGAPGRLQLVARHRSGAAVYVDYAHKPEALETVLRTLRPFARGKLVVVFGCGGDRDRGKRPVMGEIAHRLADLAIVTDDNPRSEEPAAIRAEIRRGIEQDRRNWIEIVEGRHAAIAAGMAALSSADDLLLIAGRATRPARRSKGLPTLSTTPRRRAGLPEAVRERAVDLGRSAGGPDRILDLGAVRSAGGDLRQPRGRQG